MVLLAPSPRAVTIVVDGNVSYIRRRVIRLVTSLLKKTLGLLLIPLSLAPSIHDRDSVAGASLRTTALAGLKCVICGDVLAHDEVTSDPSQQICLDLNGPAIIRADSLEVLMPVTEPLYSFP